MIVSEEEKKAIKISITGICAFIFLIVIIGTGIGFSLCANRFYCTNSEYPFAIHHGEIEQCCTVGVSPQACIANTDDNKYHCDVYKYWSISFYTAIGCFVSLLVGLFILFTLPDKKKSETTTTSELGLSQIVAS